MILTIHGARDRISLASVKFLARKHPVQRRVVWREEVLGDEKIVRSQSQKEIMTVGKMIQCPLYA